MTTGNARRESTKHIIVHASLTYPEMHVDAKLIRGWHIKNGWSDIGYHYVIRRDGVTELGRPSDRVGAHCLGHNPDSVGICLAGGLDHVLNTVDVGNPGSSPPRFIKAAVGYKNAAISANFEPAQLVSLRHLIWVLQAQYPGVNVLGHRDAVADSRPCPTFNVRDWVADGMLPTVATSLKGDSK